MPLFFLSLLWAILSVSGCTMNQGSPDAKTYPDPWVASLLNGTKEPYRSVLQSGYRAFINPPSLGGLGCIGCHSLKRGEYFRILSSPQNQPPILVPTLYSAYVHMPGFVYNEVMNMELAIRACLRHSKTKTAPPEPKTMEALTYFVQALSVGQRIATWGGKLPCLGCHSPKHAVSLRQDPIRPITLHAMPRNWPSQRPKNCHACHLHPLKHGGLTSLGFAYATKPSLNPQMAEKQTKAALEYGLRLFRGVSSTKRQSCAKCHETGPLKPFWRPFNAKDLSFAKTKTPLGPNGEVLTLSKRIQRCIDRYAANDPAYRSQKAQLALEVFIASLAEGREFRLWEN